MSVRKVAARIEDHRASEARSLAVIGGHRRADEEVARRARRCEHGVASVAADEVAAPRKQHAVHKHNRRTVT